MRRRHTLAGTNYNYGIRICPLNADAASVRSSATTKVADTEYEVRLYPGSFLGPTGTARTK